MAETGPLSKMPGHDGFRPVILPSLHANQDRKENGICSGKLVPWTARKPRRPWLAHVQMIAKEGLVGVVSSSKWSAADHDDRRGGHARPARRHRAE
jgi:hypothetical protein